MNTQPIITVNLRKTYNMKDTDQNKREKREALNETEENFQKKKKTVTNPHKNKIDKRSL